VNTKKRQWREEKTQKRRKKDQQERLPLVAEIIKARFCFMIQFFLCFSYDISFSSGKRILNGTNLVFIETSFFKKKKKTLLFDHEVFVFETKIIFMKQPSILWHKLDIYDTFYELKFYFVRWTSILWDKLGFHKTNLDFIRQTWILRGKLGSYETIGQGSLERAEVSF
jgi:hypothetical protein